MSLSINTVLPRVEYTATASQTTFSYTFPIFADSDLEVFQKTGGDPGPSDILTLTTHYTVTGANTDDGGTVVLVTGATSGDTIVIRSKLPLDRTTNFTNNGTFESSDINTQLNELTQMVKQLQSEKVARYAEDTPEVDFPLVVPNATLATHAINKGQLDAHGFTVSATGSPVVASLAALTALSTTDFTSAFVTGYSTALDGGGGEYIYDSGSAATADGVVIVAPDVGSGRWLLNHRGVVSLAQWGETGALGIGHDTTPALDAAIAAAETHHLDEIFIPEGAYYINTLPSDIDFQGCTIRGDRGIAGGATFYKNFRSTNVWDAIINVRDTGDGMILQNLSFVAIEGSQAADGIAGSGSLFSCYSTGTSSISFVKVENCRFTTDGVGR